MKKVALVLSGGGFRGAFQIGALEYLRENWTKLNLPYEQMKFDIVAGISVGSLNGLLVAANKFEVLQEFWKNVAEHGVKEIFTSDFIDTESTSDELKFKINIEGIKNKLLPNVNFDNISLWTKLQLIFCKSARQKFLKDLLHTAEQDIHNTFGKFKALADNSPLRDKICSLAKREDIKDTIYKCGYVSLNDGNYYSCRPEDFASDEEFGNGILASTVMPIIWEPVKEVNTIKHNNHKHCIDGGVRNISPLADVIDEIEDDSSNAEYLIIVVNCSNGRVEQEIDYEEKNIAQIALRSLIDISETEIFNNDLSEFIDKNYIVQQMQQHAPGKPVIDYDFDNRQPGKELKLFKALIIQPEKSSILGDVLVSNKHLMQTRLQHGREKAQEAVEKLMAEGDEFLFYIT